MRMKTKTYLTACALALTGLLATGPLHSAFARGGGGGAGGGLGASHGNANGHAGGASGDHGNANSDANSNGSHATDKDHGQDRAEDRRSAKGAEHNNADHTKNGDTNDKSAAAK